ncbi:MAG TPA: NfeD family protein [Rhodanobacteraceae bacterium]|nr:NfeD family protein [Rhodanobacteraceae bacterium]
MDSSTWLGIALLVAGALVLLSELHTLTIYLLAIAAGLFAAAGLALAGGSLTATLILLAVVVILGMPVAHWARKKLKNREADAVTHDDVGRSVTIAHADGNAWRVDYRGTTWSARPETAVATAPAAGEIWRIARREGNTLILTPSDSTNTAGGVL